MTAVERFSALHRPGQPLLLANAWDVGSARLLAGVGFLALATTSGGFAATLGRLDGSVTRDEALTHAAAMVGATDLPVSADLENAFADSPEGVAESIRLAAATGLAGCSVEDFTGRPEDPIYEAGLAAERVAAAAEAAHAGPERMVLTARTEGHLHGRRDLDETIRRLQAYAAAGADVVFAPAVVDGGDLARIVAEVDRPVSVLALPGTPPVADLAALGVARVSVGAGLALAALARVAGAARQLLEDGTYGWFDEAAEGRSLSRRVFAR